ncbi:NADH dehydrogenase [ubiquinone] flavoprotein 3, mitochondrial isoform X2 [Danio rerio]|uniref:NADH dehydrogenase [ubiquinone] flavoprotein 3, mitochondrial isoform X2 n=1 Tax=Danio rerio TaxID=7955 RepID=A0A8M3AW01_DANRE
MAMSLLRLGRLGSVKCLLRGGWSPPKTQFAAALCTKADVPPKTPKKGKASSKTIEADERASLLAYKPAVAFPSKLVATGFLSKDVALGESETAKAAFTTPANEKTTDSPPADTAAADVAVEEPKITEIPTTGKAPTEGERSKALDPDSEAKKDDEDTSSSSSSSSDSDSDSDDEEPKTEPPQQTGEKAEKKDSSVANEQVDLADKIAKPVSASFKEECVETVKSTPEVLAPSAKPVGSAETLVDPAPIVSSSATHAISAPSPKVSSSATEAISAPVPIVSSSETETISDPVPKVSTSATEAIPDPAPKVSSSATEAIPDPAPKVSSSATETIHDPAFKVSSSATQAIPEAPGESLNVGTPDIIADIPAKEVKTVPTEESIIKAEEAASVVPEVSTKASHLASPPEAPGDVAPKSEDLSAKAEAGAPSAPSEELVDPAPAAADAVEALAQTDVVETPEEQAPEKAPEPEPEPFDNTTYKNLQHHNYNMYTFTDMDVEMAKYRLPQPSSGRPSPQH